MISIVLISFWKLKDLNNKKGKSAGSSAADIGLMFKICIIKNCSITSGGQ